MNVRVHIERLILDGLSVDAVHGPAVQAAVEAELTRVLAEQGLAAGLHRGGMLAYMRGEDLRTADADTPAGIGAKIGRALGGLPG